MSEYRNLRPYDGHKYKLLVDMLAHEASVNGWEEDTLEHDGRLVVTRVTSAWNMADLYEFTGEGDVTLNCDEQRLIMNSAEFFVFEDDQGFVTVSWFRTMAESNQAWLELEEIYPKEYDEEDNPKYDDRD